MSETTTSQETPRQKLPRWKQILGGTPRVLLGIITGLFALIHFGHDTPLGGTPAAHQAFEQAFIDAGYFFPALAIFEAIAAVLLIIGRGQALALMILAPIAVNYILFKVFLDASTLVVPLIYAALVAGVLYRERFRFVPLFAKPA